jgi:DNA primase
MAGFFSDGFRERVRAASDIVDVIGAYVPLKRAGTNFTALCPFHKEKTPSFSVNPHKQIFYCFGCHKGGDVFTFVKEYEGIDFPEAVRRLADRAKIPIEYEKGSGDQQTRHLKESLLQIHDQITQRWQNALANEAGGQIARDYLAKRGVSAEAVKLFRLGYAPDLWDDTVNWAKSKGHELDLVEKAGLILHKEGGSSYYDRFRGRLMFPICDEQGRVIGFSGRILSGDEKTAKYVNSPETPIFTKSKVFFGLDKSKRALLDAEYAIVCEGQLDLIACFMAGVENIVAPQGTAFTADHARILKRYVEEVVLCFDSDNAGQNAAVRSLDSLLASGLAVRVAVMPAPHDPDSFIKASGGAAFKELIERAEGFFDFHLKRLCALNDVNTDKGRLAVLSGMAEAVHKTGNSVLIDKYAFKTASRLAVSPDAVRAEFQKAHRIQRTAADSADAESGGSAPGAETSPLPDRERWLLRIMLSHDEWVPWIAERLQVTWLRHPLARSIAETCLKAFRSGSWHGVADFLTQVPSEEERQVIAALVFDPDPDPERTLKGDPMMGDRRGVLQHLRDEALDAELISLKQRVNNPDLSDEERLELLKRRQMLPEIKKQPLTPITATPSAQSSG